MHTLPKIGFHTQVKIHAWLARNLRGRGRLLLHPRASVDQTPGLQRQVQTRRNLGIQNCVGQLCGTAEIENRDGREVAVMSGDWLYVATSDACYTWTDRLTERLHRYIHKIFPK